MLYFLHFLSPLLYFFVLIVVNHFLVGRPSINLFSSKGKDFHCTESTCGSLLFGQSKSGKGGCALSHNSKPYVLFLATDAASAAIDFSRKNLDNGMVDNPPSRRPWRSPVLSALPLKGSHCIEGWYRSPSLGSPSLRLPH